METITPSEKTEFALKPTFLQKISPLNKELYFQYIILASASIASFLLVYYITYQDYIIDLIRNNILPRNMNWMLYVSAVLVIICLLISIFAPLNEKFFKIQDVLHREESVIQEAEELIDKSNFKEAQQVIESYLEERYKFSLKKNLRNILDLLKTAQTGENIQEYLIYIEKLFDEGKKFELKRELEQIHYILFTNNEIPLNLREKLEFFKKEIENIEL